MTVVRSEIGLFDHMIIDFVFLHLGEVMHQNPYFVW